MQNLITFGEIRCGKYRGADITEVIASDPQYLLDAGNMRPLFKFACELVINGKPDKNYIANLRRDYFKSDIDADLIKIKAIEGWSKWLLADDKVDGAALIKKYITSQLAPLSDV